MASYSRQMRNNAIAVLSSLMLCGCTTKTLAFGTATKFGLDISQRPDQMIEVTLGYDRYELISIPAQEADATDAKGVKEDTYSALAIFSLVYGAPWKDEPLVLRQFFATGWAARKAAEDPKMQTFFGHKTGEILAEGEQQLEKEKKKP
jgi:hypothetical protein